MKRIITLTFAVMLIFSMSESIYASRRPRRRRSSKSTTKAEKSKSKKSASAKSSGDTIRFLISKSDSILAAGDSLSLAETFYEYFESADTVDTSAVKIVLWSMGYLATHGRANDVLKMVDKIPKIDSTLAPNAEYIEILAYSGIGRNGYAYMLANQMINRYAGTDWEKKANALANKIRGKLPNIPLKTKPQKPDTTKKEKQTTSQSEQSK